MRREKEIDFTDQIVSVDEKKQQHAQSGNDMQQEVVDFSIRVIEALEKKVTIHNEENPNKKITLAQVKKVYIRGAGDCNQSTDSDYSCGEWAMARVNLFTRAKLGQLPDLNDHKVNLRSYIDISDSWIPSQEDFASAKKIIEENNLNYDFKHIEDLFLEEEKKQSTNFEFI
tara:strand:- start:116 stop:628 length:513 start_codon:yes stop_codon:yes gene_type:complete